MEESRFNHPDYYNKNKSGIECIEIIRYYLTDIGNALKYLWRAGLKKEEGLTDIEKEIEDINKAIWYINDRINFLGENSLLFEYISDEQEIDLKIEEHPLNDLYDLNSIINSYNENISFAMKNLLFCGFPSYFIDVNIEIKILIDVIKNLEEYKNNCIKK